MLISPISILAMKNYANDDVPFESIQDSLKISPLNEIKLLVLIV